MTRPRRAAAIAAILLLLGLLIALPVGPRLGSWLIREDPLSKADVIYVLGGTRMERPLEGADLYKEGWAPFILLSRQPGDGGEFALKVRGVVFPTEADLQRSALAGMGIPIEAIDILDEEQNSTAAEARALVERATERQWKRIIFVTSRMHTRRAGLALRRRLTPYGITLIARGSRYDLMDAEHWWRDRDDLRFTLFEYQKLALYWLRIAD
ncbi:MAG: YdcF family protein [Vicinamibacterales bacterium]